MSKESALRFPMGNRYPVLHLTQDFHVRSVFLDGRSRKLSCRFEGAPGRACGQGKQVFPLAGERGGRHPKMGCLRENRLAGQLI